MYRFHEMVLVMRRGALVGLLGFSVLAPSATPAMAQELGLQVFPPETALARLAAGELSPSVIVAAFEENREQDGRLRLGNRAEYTDADRTMLLDGIEELITSVPRGSGLDRGVTDGFTTYGIIALGLWDSAPEAREIPSRLLRIYERSDNETSRSLALSHLAVILPLDPPESAAIMEILVTVATRPTLLPGEPDPSTGVNALMQACEAGAATLQRLLDEGAITDRSARLFAEDFAARGFPINEPMRRRGELPCPTP